MTDHSTSINELKRRAKMLRRKTGIGHCKALDTIANEEGFSSWSLLLAKRSQHISLLVNQTQSNFDETRPTIEEYRQQAIELANSTFEMAMRRIEPDNPELTRSLWDVEDYIDNRHLEQNMVPDDPEISLSFIEATLWHHVVELAVQADDMVETEI